MEPTLIDVPEIDGIDFDMGGMDDLDDKKDISPDLVEVIVSFKMEPKRPDLLLNNTKMFFDEEDNSYYLVDESNEPIPFYMLYDKNNTNENDSDGNKVPIDNVLFYYNSEIGENMIYGKIPELNTLETETKIKDIENKLYEGEFTIKK